jgi:hypothetical protein
MSIRFEDFLSRRPESRCHRRHAEEGRHLGAVSFQGCESLRDSDTLHESRR